VDKAAGQKDHLKGKGDGEGDKWWNVSLVEPEEKTRGPAFDPTETDDFRQGKTDSRCMHRTERFRD